jgi:hypothetical protein
MKLTFRRDPEAERAVRELYERSGMPDQAAPNAHTGFEGDRAVLHVLTSREEWQPGDERWHVSITAADRVPTWNEIAHTLHALRPGVPFVLGVPSRSWWMNVNPHVLHAWETKDWNLIEQWRHESQGHTPT